MENRNPAPVGETRRVTTSRRHALSLMLGASALVAGGAGRQFATLFQFEEAVVRDAGCLAPALAILDAGDRARGRRGLGGRKG